jgi:Skp family chaperone for outer membrane proteins
MHTRLPCALVLFAFLPSAAFAQNSAAMIQDSAGVAYFSPQRAFYQSVDGKTAQAKLSSLQAETARRLEAQNGKLKSMQAALEQSASLLSNTARLEREQEIERFQIDLQRFVEDAKAEFLGVQRELESAFLAKLRPALASVAKERGLILVLNEDAGLLAWANPALDITPEVVRRVDRP